MPDVNIDVWCAKCGAGLCNQTTVKRGSFYVEPCEECIRQSRSDGYEEGHADAEREACEAEREVNRE